MNKAVGKVQCITFHSGKLSIKSAHSVDLIEDEKSVRAVRRAIKTVKAATALWGKAVGTDIVYYTQAGRELVSFPIIANIIGLKKKEGKSTYLGCSTIQLWTCTD